MDFVYDESTNVDICFNWNRNCVETDWLGNEVDRGRQVVEKWEITSITHLDGTPRTDGRYPKRIGRTCYKPHLVELDVPLYVSYITDENGKDYRGYTLQTALITGFSVTESKITVTTLNSVYTFEKVED